MEEIAERQETAANEEEEMTVEQMAEHYRQLGQKRMENMTEQEKRQMLQRFNELKTSNKQATAKKKKAPTLRNKSI